jgi:hypothetical protein
VGTHLRVPAVGRLCRRRHRSHGRIRARSQATHLSTRIRPFQGSGRSAYSNSVSASSRRVHQTPSSPRSSYRSSSRPRAWPAQQRALDAVEALLRSRVQVAYHPFARAEGVLAREVLVAAEAVGPPPQQLASFHSSPAADTTRRERLRRLLGAASFLWSSPPPYMDQGTGAGAGAGGMSATPAAASSSSRVSSMALYCTIGPAASVTDEMPRVGALARDRRVQGRAGQARGADPACRRVYCALMSWSAVNGLSSSASRRQRAMRPVRLQQPMGKSTTRARRLAQRLRTSARRLRLLRDRSCVTRPWPLQDALTPAHGQVWREGGANARFPSSPRLWDDL